MLYTIYKVTNIINGKFYIGKHQTNDLNDGYMGSGKYIKNAIKKYGIENFTKDIIEIYDTEQKMNLAEKILVILDRNISYNLSKGGEGGFDYINSFFTIEELYKNRSLGGKRTIEIYGNRYNNAFKEASKTAFMGKKHKNSSKKIIGIKNSYNQKGAKNSQYGKPRSEETKRKIRETWKLKKSHTDRIGL